MAVVHVYIPRGCGRLTVWLLGAQIPRHVCACGIVLWFLGRMPPFSCCVAESLLVCEHTLCLGTCSRSRHLGPGGRAGQERAVRGDDFYI